MGISAQLWEYGDVEVAQRLADIVTREPMKLWELAKRLQVNVDRLDRVVQRNPFAFMFVPGPDGIDQVRVRPEPGPDAVRDRLRDMCHFARVAPRSEPYARAWVKRRPGLCQSCGDPLATPDDLGLCQPCETAALLYGVSGVSDVSDSLSSPTPLSLSLSPSFTLAKADARRDKEENH